MVLVKYVQLKSSMEEWLKVMHKNDPLFPIVDIMIGKITMYLDETLACDTWVLARIFDPGLRVNFFAQAFENKSNHHHQAQDILETSFMAQHDSPGLWDQAPSQ